MEDSPAESTLITADSAARAVRELYGLNVQLLRELDGYYDKNFYVRAREERDSEAGNNTREYVCKIWDPLHSQYCHVDGVHKLQKFLFARGFVCPQPISNIDGKEISFKYFQKGDGVSTGHMITLVSYVPGVMTSTVPYDGQLLYRAGAYLGRMDKHLMNFADGGIDAYKPLWDMSNTPRLLDFISAIQTAGQDKVTMVTDVITCFTIDVLPEVHKFKKSVIHGDFNDRNLILNEMTSPKGTKTYDISGIIDFGDTINSYFVFEVAVAICHFAASSTVVQPLEVGGHFLAGYLTHMDLNPAERECLRMCVAARYCWLLVLGAHTSAQDPGNHYVTTFSVNAWDQLQTLLETSKEELYAIWGRTVQSYNNRDQKILL